MSNHQTETDTFLRHIKPHVRFYYRAAYAITGDRQLAEQVMTQALAEAFVRGSASAPAGLRDAVIAQVREISLEHLDGETASNDWHGLPQADGKDDALLNRLLEEDEVTQRIITLRYGCAVTNREIAQIMDLPEDQVRERLSVTRLRVERELKRRKESARSSERLIMKSVRRAMNAEGHDKIDVDFALDQVKHELSGRQRPRRVIARVMRLILFSLFGLICALIIWVFGVLILM